MPFEEFYARGGLSESLRKQHADILHEIFSGRCFLPKHDQHPDVKAFLIKMPTRKHVVAFEELEEIGVIGINPRHFRSSVVLLSPGWATSAAEFLRKEKPLKEQ